MTKHLKKNVTNVYRKITAENVSTFSDKEVVKGNFSHKFLSYRNVQTLFLIVLFFTAEQKKS